MEWVWSCGVSGIAGGCRVDVLCCSVFVELRLEDRGLVSEACPYPALQPVLSFHV